MSVVSLFKVRQHTDDTGLMDAIGFMLLCSIRIFFGRLKHYLTYTAEGSIKIRTELAEV